MGNIKASYVTTLLTLFPLGRVQYILWYWDTVYLAHTLIYVGFKNQKAIIFSLFDLRVTTWQVQLPGIDYILYSVKGDAYFSTLS